MDEQIKEEVKSILSEASGVRSNIDSLYQEYRESQKAFLEISKCTKKFTFGDTLKSGESSERSVQSIFKDTIDAVHYLGGGHPNDTSKGKIETRLAYLGPVLFLLKQLGKDQLVKDVFKQYGIEDIILDEEYFSERFDGDFSKQGELAHCLERCSELQTSISANIDMVKEEIYNKIPDSAKFDKKHSPEGLKLSDFITIAKSLNKQDKQKAKDKIQENIETDITNKEALEDLVMSVL
jgi:hypothetical protein